VVDIVDPATRSRMMAGIRGKNTRPELMVRKALHRSGLRYKLNDKSLPGKPDMVFPKHRAVVFVHGCFWHGHDCHLFRMPATRRDFWETKIHSNKKRDRLVATQLRAAGWRSLVIWECAIRGRNGIGLDETVRQTADWVRFGNADKELPHGWSG
jgi:DNA mismatch endonuclease (patch repair protein)